MYYINLFNKNTILNGTSNNFYIITYKSYMLICLLIIIFIS